jgi:hypothetical protein
MPYWGEEEQNHGMGHHGDYPRPNKRSCLRERASGTRIQTRNCINTKKKEFGE